MKSYKLLTLFVFGSFFLSSCMKYQYATVSSNLQTNEYQEYVLENDSLVIKYSFSGYQGPVNISIQNKLDEPLFIDWSRSALVLNDQSNTYWQNNAGLLAQSDGFQVGWSPGFSSSSSTITGDILGEKATEFIAPNSYKQISKFTVDPDFTQLSKATMENRITIQTLNGPNKALHYSFAKEDAPIRFRTYLTLSRDPTFAQPMVYQSEFWVSEIIQAGLKPENYLVTEVNQHKYYKSKTTGFGTVMGVVGISAVLLLLGLVSPQ